MKNADGAKGAFDEGDDSLAKGTAISVIVPVYNAEKYLDRFFEAVLGQTFTDFELICVNDGSTDGSLALLEKYAKADSRVRVITQSNVGAGGARNKGMDAASGSYYIFLDSDDFAEKRMFAKMHEAITAAGADICVCRSDSYDVRSGKFHSHTRSFVERYIPKKQFFSYRDAPGRIFNMFRGWPWDKMYRAAFVTERGLRFQEIENLNDVRFVYLSLATAERITTVRDVLIHKSEHIHDSVSASPAKEWRCSLSAYRALKDGLLDAGIYGEVERSFMNRVLRNAIWNLGILSGKGIEEYYAALQGGALAEFGLDSQLSESFFDAPEDCDELKHILADSLPDYLLYKKRVMEDGYKRRIEELKASPTFRIGRIATVIPGRLKKALRKG
jgi:glycosyltransferase involved in cell wall biosynthesis